MRSYLALVSEHFSERISGSDGAPLDLSEGTLPAETGTVQADRLIEAIKEARREIRIRLRSTPAGAEVPLRLAIIQTTDAGTDMDIETAPLPIQEVNFQSETDREKLLSSLRKLEQSHLPS